VEPLNDHKTKKTRFVEPDEDPAAFEEQVESSLEQSSRRGKVKTEGYDSDSTDDGEGVVSSRKKGGPDEAEALDDMFAAPDESQGKDAGGIKEKYMRLGDIEGQEFRDGDSLSGTESELEGEPEDEDDAERRKKAGMGYELSSFNMREEMEEGKFTEDGSYIRTFDPNVVHDRWMDGISEKDIKLARRRKRELEKKLKEKSLAEEEELKEGGRSAMERDLLPFLKKGETVLEALQRIGSRSKKSLYVTPINHFRISFTFRCRKAKSDRSNIPSDVETITHLASSLLSLGDSDIYNKTYEELLRSVRSSGVVDQRWEPPSADIKYQYKWSSPEAGQSDEIFGPFSEEEIKSWYNALYFGPSGEKIKIRRPGDQEWGDWDTVVQ
jgi:CD2 antigen cytoplasmic tail-binding protein 2